MNTRDNPKASFATARNPEISSVERRRQIAAFFRERRLASGLTIEQVAKAVGQLEAERLDAYETAIDPIPLDMIFALTNVLNIAPEDVMNLIYDVYNENQDER
jgi:transcriptional regulator with XRE-family HTH domain